MGMSDMVRSAGSYNLQTSQAAINMTQAESSHLANQMQGAQNYYQMNGMYQIYQKKQDQAQPGLTSEESWRLAQENLPKRMRPNQLDPVTGKIYWPMMLTDPRYDEYRQPIDKLFAEREAVARQLELPGVYGYSGSDEATDGCGAEEFDAVQRQRFHEHEELHRQPGVGGEVPGGVIAACG